MTKQNIGCFTEVRKYFVPGTWHGVFMECCSWLSHVSLTGYCPKMSLWQEHVPCEGWLYHVWIPETLAHVYHSDARNDQPNSVYRYACVHGSANLFLLPFTASLNFLFSVPSKNPVRLSSCHPNCPGTCMHKDKLH